MKLGLRPSHRTSTAGYLCGRESFSAGKASLARLQSIKANCSLCQFTLMCWAVSYGSSGADSEMIKLLLLQGELLRDQERMTAGHSNLLQCCLLTDTHLQAKALRRKEGHRGTPRGTVLLIQTPSGTYVCVAHTCVWPRTIAVALLAHTLPHSHPHTAHVAHKLFFPHCCKCLCVHRDFLERGRSACRDKPRREGCCWFRVAHPGPGTLAPGRQQQQSARWAHIYPLFSAQ